MDIKEAIARISDGHTEWTVECAQEVCEAFQVPFDESLIDHWNGATDAHAKSGGGPKGLFPNEDLPGCGVYSLSLAYHVAKCLGITDFQSYFGRGSQARAIAASVQSHLNV